MKRPVFMCFVCISEQTVTLLYTAFTDCFITKKDGTYCAVRVRSLNKTDYMSSL